MILVTGGTGFVGKEIVKLLRVQGQHVRILARHKRKSSDPGIEYFEADISKPETLQGCCSGVNVVIHLVGILFPANGNTYESAHVEATRNILEEARRCRVSRFIHMSAIGTRSQAASRYHQTKWKAEELIRNSGLHWTIFRPSLIYGTHDPFTGLFVHMLSFPRNVFNVFTLPCMGGGGTIFKPVRVDEVANCFVRSIGLNVTVGKTIDLVGHPISFRHILEKIARSLGHEPTYVGGSWSLLLKVPLAILFRPKPIFFPVSYSVAQILLALRLRIPGGNWLLGPPIDPDVVKMLKEDQGGDPETAREIFGFKPRSFAQGISDFIKP